MEKKETSKFDIADYLDSKEMVAEYLYVVLEEGNETEIITAIGNVAKAIGGQIQVNPITASKTLHTCKI